MYRKNNTLIYALLLIAGVAVGFLIDNGIKQKPSPASSPSSRPPVSSAEPVRYTKADLENLEGTDIFAKDTLEHIFNGTVSSKGKRSGYHYDMIEDSDGAIVEGTRSEKDQYGVYTADVTVSGYRKNHYSSFYPDEWSPQQVVDAIRAARQDAIDNDRRDGDLWIGYYEGIEIDMYMNKKGKLTTAYPVYITERWQG